MRIVRNVFRLSAFVVIAVALFTTSCAHRGPYPSKETPVCNGGGSVEKPKDGGSIAICCKAKKDSAPECTNKKDGAQIEVNCSAEDSGCGCKRIKNTVGATNKCIADGGLFLLCNPGTICDLNGCFCKDARCP